MSASRRLRRSPSAVERGGGLGTSKRRLRLVRFMNHAAERLVGYTAEELLGENAQELHRTGALKAEVAECIIAEVYKGHAWQGTLFQRRRSGECVPVWSKIAPVNITGPGYLMCSGI
ncbi:hypothetical protein HPB51_001653 [Rhipicephalus microplus]|uniref:PAS domain-containing protein n=1 Tax=Rhipicephalus microplus TaxID=6941 RepID=A0A9J6EWS3_RHIMP|nr:hypothetical protein HPB51_001653 [Rhipicephalus microplus]